MLPVLKFSFNLEQNLTEFETELHLIRIQAMYKSDALGNWFKLQN